MTEIRRAVPVLQVRDVGESLRWYEECLGFTADTFPAHPPFSFAILRRGDAEIMLQCAEAANPPNPRQSPGSDGGWAIYLRIADRQILELAATVARTTEVRRGPERMFYGLVEIEIADPDGHRLCLGGEAPPGADVKAAIE